MVPGGAKARVNIAVVYCYPLVRSNTYYPLAKRFCETWRRFPPGEAHEFHVVCNGAQPIDSDRRIFSGMEARFHTHNNFGWDIGAYQKMADDIPADLMVFLGAPSHFHRPGWLRRMAEAYIENGPNLYGVTCYEGPTTHVRTTVFWCHPAIMQTYPFRVGSARTDRYGFEHGPKSLTHHVLDNGLDCVMVTWSGVYSYRPPGNWHRHMPDADDILVRDQHIHK